MASKHLHRSDMIPDWEKIPKVDWTPVQQRAAETNGWDTPANRESLKGAAYTLTGLLLVGSKSKAANAMGVGCLAYGRRCDIRDGQIAEAYQVKSPKGAALDAGLDAAMMSAALPLLTRRGILPISEALTMGALIATKTIASSLAWKRGHELHPTIAGKVGFGWLQWSAVGLYATSSVLDSFTAQEASSQVRRAATTINRFGGIPLGAVAALQYVQAAAQTAELPNYHLDQ